MLAVYLPDAAQLAARVSSHDGGMHAEWPVSCVQHFSDWRHIYWDADSALALLEEVRHECCGVPWCLEPAVMLPPLPLHPAVLPQAASDVGGVCGCHQAGGPAAVRRPAQVWRLVPGRRHSVLQKGGGLAGRARRGAAGALGPARVHGCLAWARPPELPGFGGERLQSIALRCVCLVLHLLAMQGTVVEEAVANGVMASVAGHPLWDKAMQMVVSRFQQDPGMPVLHLTGPSLLEAAVKASAGRGGGGIGASMRGPNRLGQALGRQPAAVVTWLPCVPSNSPSFRLTVCLSIYPQRNLRHRPPTFPSLNSPCHRSLVSSLPRAPQTAPARWPGCIPCGGAPFAFIPWALFSRPAGG